MEIKFIQIQISFKEEEATVDFLKFIYLSEFSADVFKWWYNKSLQWKTWRGSLSLFFLFNSNFVGLK